MCQTSEFLLLYVSSYSVSYYFRWINTLFGALEDQDMSDPLLRYDSDVTGPGPTPNNNAVDVNILLILLPAHLVSCSSLLGRNTVPKSPLLLIQQWALVSWHRAAVRAWWEPSMYSTFYRSHANKRDHTKGLPNVSPSRMWIGWTHWGTPKNIYPTIQNLKRKCFTSVPPLVMSRPQLLAPLHCPPRKPCHTLLTIILLSKF